MKEEQEDYFASSKQALKEYFEQRLLLIKLQLVEKTSKLVSSLFAGLIMAVLGFFILLFISIMLGYLFSSITGSLYIGFGIVAAFYLILFLLILFYHKQLLGNRITDIIIKIFFDQTAEEANDDDNDNTTHTGSKG